MRKSENKTPSSDVVLAQPLPPLPFLGFESYNSKGWHSFPSSSDKEKIVKRAAPSYVVCFSVHEPAPCDHELLDLINGKASFVQVIEERPDFSLAYPLVGQTTFKRVVVALPTESLRILFVAAVLANAEQAGLTTAVHRSRTLIIKIKGLCHIQVCARLVQVQQKNSLTVDVSLTEDGNYQAQFTAW